MAWGLFRRTLTGLFREWGPLLWNVGDGEGGGVILALLEAADDAGLSRSAPLDLIPADRFLAPPLPSEPPTKRPIPPKVRTEVLLRDEGWCRYCGVELTGDTYTLDHVIPEANGGPSTADNLVVSCKRCNSSKGTKSLDEWQERAD